MQRKGLNARELADQASVGASFVYDILSGKSTNPTSRKLSNVADVLGIDLMYLLYGIDETHAETDALPSQRPTGLYVGIPALTVVASMGGSAVLVDETAAAPYYFQKNWLKDDLGASPKDLRMVFISGDSMLPTLQDQDMVLVDTSQNLPSPPGIFVLFDGIGLVVKRLELIHQSDRRSEVQILSDNPQYAPYTSTLDDIRIIGRVVWFARALGRK